MAAGQKKGLKYQSQFSQIILGIMPFEDIYIYISN